MATSWAVETDEHVNYTKLCRLLYDGGTLALKTVFDGKVPPVSLGAELAKNQPKLLKLKKPKGKVLSQGQWDLLYPSSGVSPTSEDFDITLLFILLRNICGLTKPATGWDALPPSTDPTLEAKLVRIKFYRNTVIAHGSKAAVDGTTFEAYWKDISGALVSLGLKQVDIDYLKVSPLGEKDYNQLLKDWALSDKEIKQQLEDVKTDTAEIKTTASEIQSDTAEIKAGTSDIKSAVYAISSQIQNTQKIEVTSLPHIDYGSLIRKKCNLYHPSTRQWIFEQIEENVKNRASTIGAGVVVVRAGPGMGKSIVAAKICQMYDKKVDQGNSINNKGVLLGGCHFFQHSDSNRNNPRIMLQSIARQLCDSVPGYQEALKAKLKTFQGRSISNMNCEELLGVLFEEPLSQINIDHNVVIVIDALDECASQFKKELEDAFERKLSILPPWIQFVITTRPLPSFRCLSSGIEIGINPSDPRNKLDVENYLSNELTQRNSRHLTDKCKEISKGLFLVAYFIIGILDQSDNQSLQNVMERLSHGIASVYEYYFTRIKDLITPYLDTTETENSFFMMLEAVVASQGPIPKEMFYKILRLKSVNEVPREKRMDRNEAVHLLHTIFPVENDHVTVFHKTVTDWLTLDADKNPYPEFSVCASKGVEVLAEKCCDVYKAFKEREKPLDQPLVLSDSEMYLFQFGIGYIDQSSQLAEPWTDEAIGHSLMMFAVIVSLKKGSSDFKLNLQDPVKSVNLSMLMRILTHFDDVKVFVKICFGHWLSMVGDFILNLSFFITVKEMDQLRSFITVEEKDQLCDWLTLNKLPYYSCSLFPCSSQLPDERPYRVGRDFLCQIENGFITAMYMYREKGWDVLHVTDYGRLGEQKLFKESHEIRGVSPDKKYLIITTEYSVTTEYSDKVELYDVTTLVKVQEYNCPSARLDSFYIFGDAEQWYIVVKAIGDTKIFILNGLDGQLDSTIGVSGDSVIVAVSQYGHLVIAKWIGAKHFEDLLEVDKDTIYIVNFRSPSRKMFNKFDHSLLSNKLPSYCFKFSIDENYLVISDIFDEVVYVFHTSDGTVYRVITFPITHVALIPFFLSPSSLIIQFSSRLAFYDLVSSKLIYCTKIPEVLSNLVMVPPQGTDKFIPALYEMFEYRFLVKVQFHSLEQNFLTST